MNVKAMPLTMDFLDERIEFLKILNEQREIQISKFLNYPSVCEIPNIVKDMTEVFSFMVKLKFIKNFILNEIPDSNKAQYNRATIINWFDEYYQGYINQANNQFDKIESLNIDCGGPSKDEFNMFMLNIHSEFMKNI